MSTGRDAVVSVETDILLGHLSRVSLLCLGLFGELQGWPGGVIQSWPWMKFEDPVKCFSSYILVIIYDFNFGWLYTL